MFLFLWLKKYDVTRRLEALAAVVRQDVWPKISGELGDDVYSRLKAEVGMD